MKLPTWPAVLAGCVLLAPVEASMRIEARSPSPTTAKQTSTPSPSPTPTKCHYPAASPPIVPTATCSAGRRSFALQIQDCDSPVNGRYAKVRVSYVDTAGAKPPLPDQLAHLWISITPCKVFGCEGGNLLTDQPTTFFLDGGGNLYVDPASPLGVNGSWVLPNRMDYDVAQANLPGAVIPLLDFNKPGTVMETRYQNAPVMCSVSSMNEFQCSVTKDTESVFWGTLGGLEDTNTTGMGVGLVLAPAYLWSDNCQGLGGVKPCGRWKVIAVPACL